MFYIRYFFNLNRLTLRKKIFKFICNTTLKIIAKKKSEVKKLDCEFSKLVISFSEFYF